jgi:hypothetical protein
MRFMSDGRSGQARDGWSERGPLIGRRGLAADRGEGLSFNQTSGGFIPGPGRHDMPHRRDIIVIGGSAGAYQALAELAAALPVDFPASVFVVLHLQTRDLLGGVPGRSGLVARITRTGQLPVHVALDGEPIVPGRIYLAPGGHNMLLDHGRVRVLSSPRENLIYPSINALFRTAAVTYGPRVVGVVLSGLLNDGVAGLWEITQRGGLAVVQEPQEAPFPDMPQAALADVAVDYCVPVAQMAPLLQTLVSTPLPAPPRPAHTRPGCSSWRMKPSWRWTWSARSRRAGTWSAPWPPRARRPWPPCAPTRPTWC